jgi:hypothetical protein
MNRLILEENKQIGPSRNPPSLWRRITCSTFYDLLNLEICWMRRTMSSHEFAESSPPDVGICGHVTLRGATRWPFE